MDAKIHTLYAGALEHFAALASSTPPWDSPTWRHIGRGLAMAHLKRFGSRVADEALRKVAPREKTKVVQQTAKALHSRRAPRDTAKWWTTHRAGLELLLESKGWPERSSEASGLYTIHGLVVHDTLGMPEKKLRRILETVAEAASSIETVSKDLGEPFDQVLYGEVLVVDKIRGKRMLAWYQPDTDRVYLRPLPGDATGLALLHELAHRYWRRFMGALEHSAWRAAYRRSMAHARARVRHFLEEQDTTAELQALEPGDEFPLPVAGMRRGGPPVVTRVGTAGSYGAVAWELLHVPSGKKGVVKLADLRRTAQARAERAALAEGFPGGSYAASDPEEYFAETVSHLALGEIDERHVQELQRALLPKARTNPSRRPSSWRTRRAWSAPTR